MENKYLCGGYILLSRLILFSEIWRKPPEYLKIFIYILLKVNHEDGLFPRGSNFFNFSEERPFGTTKTQIYEFLRWAKSEKINFCTTQKTTRGVIIKVNNYSCYQNPENYKNQHENQHSSNTAPTQLQNNSNTINNNEIMKELNNVNSILPKESKKTYGTYKNIKLTDKEYNRFIDEFGEANTKKLIEFLSAYKEEKNYKTKSDNLTIRRWVIKACGVNKIDDNYGGF